jgi:hypothetical protein
VLRKILAGLTLGAVLMAGCAFGYLYFRKPAMAPPGGMKVEITPERIARGKHLFQNLLDCDGCHFPAR